MEPIPSFSAVRDQTADQPATAKAPPPATTPEYSPKLDTLVLQGLRGAFTYIVLFLLGHLGLRRLRQSGGWPYAGIGAVSAVAMVSSMTPMSTWRYMSEAGHVSWYLGVVLLAGAVMGFAYRRNAGLEAEGDDPWALEAELTARQTSDAAGDEAVLVQTESAQYFSGPVQVRTSLPIAFVAALLSSGAFALCQILIGAFTELPSQLALNPGAHLVDMIARSLTSQALALVTALVAPVPFALVVLGGHLLARARGLTSYKAYLIIGAGSPLLLGLLAGPVGIIMGFGAIIPLAIAMATYRNWAGLEPKPVKEDIILNDPRYLVGENHARRRFGRLIKN